MIFLRRRAVQSHAKIRSNVKSSFCERRKIDCLTAFGIALMSCVDIRKMFMTSSVRNALNIWI